MGRNQPLGLTCESIAQILDEIEELNRKFIEIYFSLSQIWLPLTVSLVMAGFKAHQSSGLDQTKELWSSSEQGSLFTCR